MPMLTCDNTFLFSFVIVSESSFKKALERSNVKQFFADLDIY